MKIRLDEKEIVAIVQEWARMVHKTKNVSSIFQVDITPAEIRSKKLVPATLNQIFIELDVVIGDENYSGGLDGSYTHEAILRAKQAILEHKHPDLGSVGLAHISQPSMMNSIPSGMAGPPLDSNEVPNA